VDVYGPSNEKLVAAASGMPNLSVHGAIPYEAVPGVLARARVGLLPFTRTALNRGRSPMKLYEYLAAGLAVLTSEPVRTDGPVAEVTFSYEDMDDMRRAAARALQADASGEPIRQFVATKDWASNAQQLMEFAVGLRAIADGATR
jgi:glycosyltransferase involved in cell wall biosynthesis